MEQQSKEMNVTHLHIIHATKHHTKQRNSLPSTLSNETLDCFMFIVPKNSEQEVYVIFFGSPSFSFNVFFFSSSDVQSVSLIISRQFLPQHKALFNCK